jgi:hypothetical protein
MRAARQFIKGPFAVINADDFYGADAFQVLCSHLKMATLDSRMLMVGYPLENTLSPHGSVNRGICQQKNGTLLGVREIEDIKRQEDGTIRGTEADGTSTEIEESALVSMNFWGFSENIFPLLEEQFIEFLAREKDGLKAEFYIPAFVDDLIDTGQGACSLLSTTSKWFGITYPEDKAHVQEQLKVLVEEGEYPSPLKL